MKKGQKLEMIVKSSVENLLKSGKLGLNSEFCKVYLNKGYYSKDREKEIIVDVSIELLPPNTSRPTLIWIWECKDYNNSIPVDDIEEFHAKLEQIGADNTKGTMITTGSYQESTIKYATSKGIGLTRLLEGGEIDIYYSSGMYLPLRDETVCYNVLTHKSGRLSWNNSTHYIQQGCNEYFFGLINSEIGVLGLYSSHLDWFLINEFYQSRAKLKWLDFSRNPRELSNEKK